jgi:hypothetical protein
MYGWVCGAVDPKKTDVELLDQIENELATKLAYLQFRLPNNMSENKKNALLQREYEKQAELLRVKMMDPKNMRYPKDTNQMLSLLFRQRLRAQLVLTQRFKTTHPNGPILPLTDQSKEDIMEDIETPSTTANTSPNVSPLTSRDDDDDDEAPELVPLNANANVQNAADIQNLANISFAQNNNNNNNTKKQGRFARFNPFRYFYRNKNKPANSSCDPNNIYSLTDFTTIKEKKKECCPTAFGFYRKNRDYCNKLDSHYRKIYDNFRRNATNQPGASGGKTRRGNRNSKKSRRSRK